MKVIFEGIFNKEHGINSKKILQSRFTWKVVNPRGISLCVKK